MRVLIPQWHIRNQKCVGEVNHWLEQRVNVLLSEVYFKWFLTAGVAQAAVWAWKEAPWADLREAVELTKKQKSPDQYANLHTGQLPKHLSVCCVIFTVLGLPTQPVTVGGSIDAPWCFTNINKCLWIHAVSQAGTHTKKRRKKRL